MVYPVNERIEYVAQDCPVYWVDRPGIDPFFLPWGLTESSQVEAKD